MLMAGGNSELVLSGSPATPGEATDGCAVSVRSVRRSLALQTTRFDLIRAWLRYAPLGPQYEPKITFFSGLATGKSFWEQTKARYGAPHDPLDRSCFDPGRPPTFFSNLSLACGSAAVGLGEV